MAHLFVEHLKKDHQKQHELGEKLRNATSLSERERWWEELYLELYPRVLGEEASIFPFLQSKGEGPRVKANEALQEHHVAKLVMREMLDMVKDTETFHAKAYVLDEFNRHHTDEEEKEHFPMMERLASQEKLNSLFQDYENAEESAKKEAKKDLK